MPRLQLLSAGVFLTAIATLSLGTFTRPALATEIDAPRLFHALDANGDGAVTRDEAGGEHRLLLARLFRTGDANGDGRLDADEFAAGLTPMRVEKEMVEKQGSRLPGSDALLVLVAMMDADGNRQLVAGEIPQRFRQVFQQFVAQADADKNGKLDERELGDKGPQLSLLAQVAATRLGIDVQGELEKLPKSRRQAMEQMGALPRLEDIAGDPKQAQALFDKLDANGDEALSADEVPDGLTRLLERGDRDGDGKLSMAEFQAMVRRVAAMNDPANNPASAPPADPGTARRNIQQILNRSDRNGDGRIGRKEAPPRIANNFDRLDKNGDGQLDAEELQRLGAARGTERGRGDGLQPEMVEEMQK